MMVDDPQSFIVGKKDELAAVVASQTGYSVEDFDRFWFARIRKINQSNRFVE